MLKNSKLILSLILCSRNDAYMGNSRWRLETSINLALLNARDANFLDKLEILVCDWGSDIPLSEVLNLVPEANSRVKFVHVPPVVAKVEQKDSKFPEVIALNAAARRAKGEFIGRIDNDTIVGEEFFKKFSEYANGHVYFPYDLNSSFLFVERRSVPYRFTKKSPELKLVQLYLKLTGQSLKIETSRDYGRPYWWSPVGIMLFHRDIWYETRGYDEKLIYWGWMEGDLAIRLEQKHKLVDFRDFVGNHLYHLEHYHNLTDYENRNGPATPRKKNKVVEEGLSYKVNDQNWGLNCKDNVKYECYDKINVTNYKNPIDLSLLSLLKFPFELICLKVLLKYDTVKLQGIYCTLVHPIRKLKIFFTEVKVLLLR